MSNEPKAMVGQEESYALIKSLQEDLKTFQAQHIPAESRHICFFEMWSPAGTLMHYTVRGAWGETHSEYISRTLAFEKMCLAAGLMVNRAKPTANGTAHTANDVPPGIDDDLAPSDFGDVSDEPSEGGVAKCVMLKVEGQYSDKSKPKLVFECDGMDFPITCSMKAEKMAELMKPIGFTTAHIKIGKKYATPFWVRWVKEGKYRNVVTVSKSQPA